MKSAITPGAFALLRPPAMHFGVRAGAVLEAIVAERAGGPVLPVVTSSLRDEPAVTESLAVLGEAALPVFGGLRPHTPLDVVLALAGEITRTRPAAIVVFGGGSAIDAVKIAALAATTGARDRAALLDLRAVPDAEGRTRSWPALRTICVIAVPTTLSGAEFGPIGGATDTEAGVKSLYRADDLAPNVVVFDPWLATRTPAELWLSTGIRALDHAVETLLSRDANPYTDALALRAISLLAEGLPASRARSRDESARHVGQLGSWLAACAIGRVRYGASHGLGHQLGAVAGVPHGITSCVLLPAVLAYDAPISGAVQADIARALGREGVPASDVVRDFVASLGLPVRISALGIARGDLPRIAETSLANPFVRANIRPVTTVADAMAILEAAY